MAKGIIYSMTSFIIGALIITLAMLIFNSSQNTELRATEINLLNGIYDLESSLSESISTLFSNTANIDIKIQNNTITIEDIVPNIQLEQFKNNLTQLKSFVEEDNSLVNIDLSQIDKLPLQIKPYSIVYERDILNNKKIQLKNNDVNNYYTLISITLNTTGILGIISAEEITPGIIPLTIKLQNSTSFLTQNFSVDITKENEIKTEEGAIIFEIETENGIITIENKALNVVQVTTKLELQDISTLNVVYPSIIHINFPEFQVYSIKDAKIT